MVDQASKEVTDSAKRYDEAKAKYEEILKQYEALVNNNITSNLDALELKLANAKNELAEADFNLNEAQKASFIQLLKLTSS
jgi:chromosome segregation ATPase